MIVISFILLKFCSDLYSYILIYISNLHSHMHLILSIFYILVKLLGENILSHSFFLISLFSNKTEQKISLISHP